MKVRVVIAYDIVSDRRRNKVFKILKNFGFNVQLSVFVAEVSPRTLKKLEREVVKHLNLEEDCVHFYFLCRECAAKTVRLGVEKVRRDEVMVL
ncbi:MAG: CRISPR-associated protein Cas2 [Eubacteriales bacterium]|nr:CRISPR-associated protein Cas2 [Eubacteriales bacterium]